MGRTKQSKLSQFKMHFEDNADKFKPSARAGQPKPWYRRAAFFVEYTVYNFIINTYEAIRYIMGRVM